MEPSEPRVARNACVVQTSGEPSVGSGELTLRSADTNAPVKPVGGVGRVAPPSREGFGVAC